jgi:hypothetical protein
VVIFLDLFNQYVFFFENLSLSKSFPKILTRKLVGVRIAKKTKAITNGAIIFPRISPNFIQEWFSGFNIFGCKKAIAKKIIDSIKDQILISEKFRSCHTPTIKNRIEKIIPKLFSDDFFIN